MKCLYCCSGGQGKCVRMRGWGRWARERSSCCREVEETQYQPHDLFFIRANDSPLSLVTPDLFLTPQSQHSQQQPDYDDNDDDGDPFEPTGFITAFSTWSLEPTPIYASSSFSFSGHLAELERAVLLLDSSSPLPNNPPNNSIHSNSSSSSSASAPVVLDNLRAYLQIVDVASILGVDRDISDHAFQLFRD